MLRLPITISGTRQIVLDTTTATGQRTANVLGYTPSKKLDWLGGLAMIRDDKVKALTPWLITLYLIHGSRQMLE